MAQYLKQLGCGDVLDSEGSIKKELGLPSGPSVKCADGLGFLPSKVSCREFVVAESKGIEVSKAIVQLGNVAAGVWERYGAGRSVALLVYSSTLRKVDAGFSPGNGYLVKRGSVPQVYELLDATSSNIVPARAVCELGAPWSRWNPKLRQLPIRVFVESPPVGI